MTFPFRPRAQPDREPRWLLLRFAVFTAIAFLIAAIAIIWLVHNNAKTRAEEQVSLHTQFVAAAIVRHELRPGDLTAPVEGQRLREIDQHLGSKVIVHGTLKVKIYNLDGRVIYSTDHSEIGLRGNRQEIAKVVAVGLRRQMTSLGPEGGQGGARKVIESYVPLRLSKDGPVVGVFELYQDYAPVRLAAMNTLIPVSLSLAMSLIMLYLALFPLLRRVTDILKSRNERLQEQADELRETLLRREQAEEALRQAQKMDAVGRLAGGVAHDFNNLLLVIRGYTSLLLTDMDADDPHRRDLTEIENATEKASTLTGQLLTFSRRRAAELESLDLNQVVRESETLLSRLLSEDIEITYVLPEEPSYVCSDAGQLGQVLMNLAVNARDVMPSGGQLNIAVGRETRTEDKGTLAAGEYVTLKVSDTGSGMDDEIRARIFEPFYTTKEVGKGTGLGLSIVYGIVAQAAGTIEVDSTPGQGSTFTIYLPLCDAPVKTAPVKAAPVAPTATGETILLAEDEEAVRRLLGGALSKQGYNVIQASDGRDALVKAAEYEGAIDLLLTDVVMPQMGGPELARRLTDIRPETRILYMSGYVERSFEAFGGQTEELERSGLFLQKPFEIPVLVNKIRTVLAAEEA